MSLENGIREHLIEQCSDCEWARETLCLRYLEPKRMWRSGICPSATHMHKQQTPEQKKRAGQQHQRKGKQLSKKQQESYKRLT